MDARNHVLNEASDVKNQFPDLTAMERDKNEGLSIEMLTVMVRERPAYQELLKKLHFHMDLFGKVQEELGASGLFSSGGGDQGRDHRNNQLDLSVFEQDLACGVDREGKEVKPLKSVAQLSDILIDRNIGAELKVRFLLLYFAVIENVPETSRKQLIAQLPEPEQKFVLNLVRSGLIRPSRNPAVHKTTGAAARMAAASAQSKKFGVFGKKKEAEKLSLSEQMEEVTRSAVAGAAPPCHRASKHDVKKYKGIAKTAQYDMCRFEPILKDVAEELLRGVLSDVDFPVVGAKGEGESGGGPREVVNDQVGVCLDQVDVDAWAVTWDGNGLAYPHRTGFSAHSQTSVACRICGVHVTVICYEFMTAVRKWSVFRTEVVR